MLSYLQSLWKCEFSISPGKLKRTGVLRRWYAYIEDPEQCSIRLITTTWSREDTHFKYLMKEVNNLSNCVEFWPLPTLEQGHHQQLNICFVRHVENGGRDAVIFRVGNVGLAREHQRNFCFSTSRRRVEFFQDNMFAVIGSCCVKQTRELGCVSEDILKETVKFVPP